ncbi:hypothetical protein QQS21_008253 [Conoideocrella luteorostrata]|uniref:Peptidase metallopeptidase domain-containing protein n=1 Tax=Conoideocrella luteorostrata TaxID=1105319 RepID=A0AAJ0CLW8_9HYPO|nr:hypothetical protein QQS21_008253 [Conoideocrella luteorostrata]
MAEPTVSFPYCSADATLVDYDEIPGSNLVSQEGAPSFLASNKTLWWPKGKKIKVRFLNGSPTVQQKVKSYAETWEEYANIDFQFIKEGDADVRVAFKWVKPGGEVDLGTWSQVGTNAKTMVLSKDQPTMNFGNLDDNSREEDFCRDTTHEFGHAIGCVHEHQAWAIPWDEPRVIADCKRMYKWSESQTRAQIIKPEVDLNRLTKSNFDSNSIMCYYYPKEWTKDHSSAPFNVKLSATDKSFIGKMYPFQTRNSGELSIYPEIRNWNLPVPLNSKEITFTPPYNVAPRMAIGLKSLDISNTANIRVRAAAQTITEDKFSVSMDTWGDTQLFNATSTWIEFERTSDAEYEVGEFNTLDTRGLGQLQTPDKQGVRRDTEHFDFPEGKYTEPPNVLVWLSAMDMDKTHNWRVRAKATTVTTTGFDLAIETWGDTVLYSATASWVAYPKNSQGATGGRVSTEDLRQWFPAVANNSKKVKFPAKFFDKVPKVFIAISALDMDSSVNLRVKVSADKIDAYGFTWHGDSWADSQLYTVSADWVAFG